MSENQKNFYYVNVMGMSELDAHKKILEIMKELETK